MATGVNWLREAAAADAKNLGRIEVLGTLWGVAGHTSRLYVDLVHALFAITQSDLTGAKKLETSHCLLVSTFFFFTACRAATLSCLDIGRLHFQEAAAKTRRALEMTAYASMCWEHPHLCQVWRDAGRGKSHFAEFRRAFSKDAVQKALNALDPALYGAYDRSSRSIHGSIVSLAESYHETEGRLGIRFQDLQNDDPAHMALELLSVATTHAMAQDAFVKKVMRLGQWRAARKEWSAAKGQPRADLARARRDWFPRIASFRETIPRPDGA